MKKIKELICGHKIITSCVLTVIIAAVAIVLFGAIGVWYALIVAAMVGIALSDMRKHGLLKVLSILLLLILLLTNVLTGRQNVIDSIGIADIFIDYFSIVLQNFSYIILFILCVGGLYGVLNKTAAYKKLLDNIVTKLKGYGKKPIYLIIVLFAIITALTGITIPQFIFIPFIVSITLLLGYDKLVAYSATFASIIIGYIGGIFVNFVNPNTYQTSTFDEFVGLSGKFVNVFPKLLLLFSGIALLIYFVDRHIKNVEAKKVKYDLNDDRELLIAEVKGDYKDIKTWPLITILSLSLVIIIIGMVPWTNLFGIDIFSKFHTWLLSLKIKDFVIIPRIISGNLPALGEWTASGNFMAIYVYSSMLVIFMTVLVALVNKMKLNVMLDHFTEGAKKLLPAAALITIAYTVLVCSYNNGFYEVVISNYGKFNYGISSLLAFGGSILNVDITWILLGVYSPIIELITDESVYSSISILLQGIYGVFQLVGPTSLIMIIGLSYLEIPYTTWLKYIWRFVLVLILVISAVTFIITVL